MSVSAHQDLPAARRLEQIEIHTTEEQDLVIRKAAELVGWTVPEYILCTILDRAERDLYEHAALEPGAPLPEAAAEPLTALIGALG